MSRAPKNEPASIPLHSAIGPYGVIDFADSPTVGLLASSAPGGVVGGPPAYLEAHGIRYIPSSSTNPDENSSSSLSSAVDLDAESSSLSSYVSPEELNSRVDDRIKQFMQTSSSAPLIRMDNSRPATMRAPAGASRSSYDDYRNSLRSTYRAPALSSGHDAVGARLRALRRECEATTKMASSPVASDDNVTARLRSLRRECEMASARPRRSFLDF